jgi:hypothetical protein
MSKLKTHSLILEVLEKMPMTEDWLRKTIIRDHNISILKKVLYEHLKRGVKRGEIGSLWRKEDKIQDWNAREVTKLGFGVKSQWKKSAKYIWIRTKETERVHNKLTRRYGKKESKLIREVVDAYRGLEIITNYQTYFFEKDKNAKEAINQFHKKKVRINFPFSKLGITTPSEKLTNKWKKACDILRMNNEYMHYIAFRNRENREKITLPMYDRLGSLFARKNNLIP